MTTSVLEMHLDTRLPPKAVRRMRDPEQAHLRVAKYWPMGELVFEPSSSIFADRAKAALRTAMQRMGVGDLADSLVDVVLACATVQQRDWATGAKTEGVPSGAEFPADALPPTTEPRQDPSDLARSKALLGVVESVNKVSNKLDGVLFSATRQLTASRAALLLREKGAESTDDLNNSQREALRKSAKSQTRKEIEAAIGWVPGEVTDLVAAANTPVAVAGPMLSSMMSGESSWRYVRRCYRESRGLAHEDAAAIANGLFGNDPETSVTERLDSSDSWLGGPWHGSKFNRALEREVAKVNSRDEQAKQEARDRAKANKDVRAVLDEIGTAVVTLGCSPLQAAAIADRVERAARSARKAGAPETLRELRTAIVTALLLHGTLDMDSLPDDPDLITVEQSLQLKKVLEGLPAAELNVIVSLETLLGVDLGGAAATVGQGATPTTESGEPIPASFLNSDSFRSSDSLQNSDARGAAGSCTCLCTCGATSRQRASASVSTGELCPTGEPCPPSAGASAASGASPASDASPANGVSASSDASATGGRTVQGGVGAVIGRHPTFLRPDEVRLLALMPGSTLYRLLTDPASGRCVERSIKAYPFDAAMRAQIIASDVFCRAPGCLKPARLAQMDHVQEHGTPGGHTCEANGQPVCDPHHDQKTKKAWDAVLESNRDVTWTTMLGRIYRTKAHDFRQYTKLLTAATTEIHEAINSGADREDTINAAIYQAMSYRDDGDILEADESDDDYFGWDLVSLAHVAGDGRRSNRPHPDVRQAEMDRHRATRSEDGDVDGGGESEAGRGTGSDAVDGDTGGSSEKSTEGGRGPSSAPQTPWSQTEDEPPPF